MGLRFEYGSFINPLSALTTEILQFISLVFQTLSHVSKLRFTWIKS